MSYKGRYDDRDRDRDSRRHARRDSPPRRRRSPSPERRERDPKGFPEQFGRIPSDKEPTDDLNVIQLMKSSYTNSPLNDLYQWVKNEVKIKVWTRNFKEVRGILSGYVIAFDKHWNLVLRDVDEVYIRPKKSKTPFLRDLEPNETLPDMQPKVPRKKKDGAAIEKPPPVLPKEPKEGEPGGKKRRKKSKKTTEKRHVAKMFVRGDNIVMICPLYFEEEEEEDDDDIEEVTEVAEESADPAEEPEGDAPIKSEKE